MRVSDCQDLDVINTLDGFNLQPRLSIPFDGPIDVSTVSSRTVFLISMRSTLPGGRSGGTLVGIDQIVWDVATTTLYVESDEMLDQHTRYVVIVTNGVRAASGAPVAASEAFQGFRPVLAGLMPGGELLEYRQSLLDGLAAARGAGVADDDIVVASVFTTQSATAVLEKIRDQLKAVTPEPADFLLGPDGMRTMFEPESITRLTYNQQTRVTGDLNPVDLTADVRAPQAIAPGAVGQLAFGKYRSPDFMVHPGEYIPPFGTRSGVPAVQSMDEVYFTLALPSGMPPAGGWPVAIFGHGTPGTDTPRSYSLPRSLRDAASRRTTCN